MSLLRGTVVLAILVAARGFAAPSAAARAGGPVLPRRARVVVAFRAAEARGDARAIARVLVSDSRVWFEARTGPGERRDPGGKDSYADWDRFFHAEKKVDFVAAAGDSAEFELTETSEFYRLAELPPSHARLVYWFDRHDRITGTLVQSIRPHVPPRITVVLSGDTGGLAGFKAWERRRDPAMYERLLPGGMMAHDLERARLWKRELEAWHEAARMPVPQE